MRRSVIVVLGCFLAASCARNPVTKKLELSMVSESQEIQMGKEATVQIQQQMGFYPDPKLEAYVNGIGQELAKSSERPNLPWQFHVVDDAAVNAFALPGGSIFLTRGILSTLNDEAELAAVLGHEIAHVTAKHSVKMISRQQMAQLGLGLGMILSPTFRNLGQLAGGGMQLLFLKFSRDAEGQADDLGFKYMIQHGYDAREMLPLFQTLSRVGQIAGGGKLPEYLQTHPYPEQRMKDTQIRLDRTKRDFNGSKRDEQEYLSFVNGIVYGEDPRQGFFQGALFLHPGMRFQMRFPDGWKTANLPQAVVAVSPKQDAAIQLASAGKATPEEAAKQFFSQQGIQQGQASQGLINGQPAVIAYFAAQAEQGPVGGLVTFLRHGDQTFALIGFTAAQGLQAYDPTFRATMGSFAQMTDPNVLNVQPARLELVRVERDMGIEEFARLHPSNAPITELALINGVGNGEPLKAGQMAKRIVGGPARTAAPKQALVK